MQTEPKTLHKRQKAKMKRSKNFLDSDNILGKNKIDFLLCKKENYKFSEEISQYDLLLYIYTHLFMLS